VGGGVYPTPCLEGAGLERAGVSDAAPGAYPGGRSKTDPPLPALGPPALTRLPPCALNLRRAQLF
jgi:hypothetical protein